MKITDQVYVVSNVIANPYIIVDADGLTLIDTGIPRSEKKILAFIASLGKSPQDLKRIILTHSDLDHVGSLAALVKATGARTYASRVEAEFIAQGKSSREPRSTGFSLMRIGIALMKPFIKVTPFQVDEFLTDGQILPVLGGLRVLETIGHTPGHISLFSPSASVLFCGDSMVTDSHGIHGSRPPVTWDETKAREAEAKQAAFGAKIVCSGHGPVVMDALGKYPHS
jgi:glyoxylase-like metal-dependent hydrolase (beta-lactamase superfamily II)